MNGVRDHHYYREGLANAPLLAALDTIAKHQRPNHR
jgi:hypothetical protein